MLSELELHLGVYTQKELAQWIGVCERTLKRNKEKYLEELKEYAKYELTESSKIDIKYIKIPIYVKKDSTYRKVEKNIARYWNKNGLDTKRNATYRLYSKEEFTVKYETVYSYASKITNIFWGKPNELEGGTRGNCRWILCVKNTNTKELRFFTSQEQKMQELLRKKYFNEKNSEIKAQKEIKEALVLQKKKKEITIEEYNAAIIELQDNLDFLYFNYLDELQNILPIGDEVSWGIYVEDDIYFNDEKNDFLTVEELGVGVQS